MKKIFAYLFLGIVVLLGNACSNDFDVTADWKSIPVVYGFLSPQDTATYIRIEKAFLDESQSALELAQIPDSLYYQDINVVLKRGNVEYPLTRVDGNLEGYVRKSGVFADAPNYLYKLVFPAGTSYVGGQTYELEVTREDGSPVTSASTKVINPVEILKPSVDEEWTWNLPNSIQNKAEIDWRINDNTGALFDVTIRVKYAEAVDGNPNNRISKSVEWKFLEGVEPEPGTSTIRNDMFGEDFFSALGLNLIPENDGPRYFNSVEIEVSNGGEEILEFTTVVDANSGLTGSNIPPVYTNVENGFGIFTSRNTSTITGIDLLQNARDSLMEGQYTRHLNFQ